MRQQSNHTYSRTNPGVNTLRRRWRLLPMWLLTPQRPEKHCIQEFRPHTFAPTASLTQKSATEVRTVTVKLSRLCLKAVSVFAVMIKYESTGWDTRIQPSEVSHIAFWFTWKKGGRRAWRTLHNDKVFQGYHTKGADSKSLIMFYNGPKTLNTTHTPLFKNNLLRTVFGGSEFWSIVSPWVS